MCNTIARDVYMVELSALRCARQREATRRARRGEPTLETDANNRTSRVATRIRLLVTLLAILRCATAATGGRRRGGQRDEANFKRDWLARVLAGWRVGARAELDWHAYTYVRRWRRRHGDIHEPEVVPHAVDIAQGVPP